MEKMVNDFFPFADFRHLGRSLVGVSSIIYNIEGVNIFAHQAVKRGVVTLLAALVWACAICMVDADIGILHKGLVGLVNGDAGFLHGSIIFDDLLRIPGLYRYSVYLFPSGILVHSGGPVVLPSGKVGAVASFRGDLEDMLLGLEASHYGLEPFTLV